MVNDTTTLNGALAELGETMATNITAKGVSASASDGLTTLAGKILQISGGGGSSITLSSNKNILSYYDSESATLTATYQTGATMELYNANTMTKIGNFTETTSGTYTYTYNSNGDGDIYLVAKVGSTTSDPVTIEDCIFYGINTNAFTIPSNTTFTSDGTKITATTSTSGEKIVSSKHAFNQNDNFEYEVEVAAIGSVQSVAVVWDNTAHWGGQSNNSNKAFANLTGSDSQVSHTFAVGDKYKVIRDNGTTSVYINDTLITSASVSYNSTFTVGFYINPSRTQYYKNIKIKLVNGVTPPSPTPTSDCSQYTTQISNAIEYINGSGT